MGKAFLVPCPIMVECTFVVMDKDALVVLGYSPFYGQFFNLRDKGIQNYRMGEVGAENCDGSIFGKTALYYRAE